MDKVDSNIIKMISVKDVLVILICKINGLVEGHNEIIKRIEKLEEKDG